MKSKILYALLAVVCLSGHASVVEASVPTDYGNTTMQRTALDLNNKYVKWCNSTTTQSVLGGQDTNSWWYYNLDAGVGPENYAFHTDQSESCQGQKNEYYRVPPAQSFMAEQATSSSKLPSVIAVYAQTTVGTPNVQWVGNTGASLTEETVNSQQTQNKNFTIGTETYTMVVSYNSGLANGNTNQGFIEWYEKPQDTTDLKLYALLYTSTDVYNTIVTASDFQSYMDNLFGVADGIPTSSGSPTLLNPLQWDTKFTALTMSTYATGSAKASYTYYIDPDEVNRNTSAYNPTHIEYRWSLRPSTDFEKQSISIGEVTGTGSGDIIIDDLADGIYDLVLSFSNTGCFLHLSTCPFEGVTAYKTFTISGGVLLSQESAEFPTPDQENPDNLFDALTMFYMNMLESKHPTAWVFQTLSLIRSYADGDMEQYYDDAEANMTFDLVPLITNATSSDGYFNFLQYQGLESGLNEMDLNFIESACSTMTSWENFNCTIMKAIIEYTLYFSLIAFYGLLLWKFVKTSEQ